MLNIPLPFKQVSVHVQDPAGNPLANIGVSTSDNYENPLTAGSLSGLGSSYYNPGATATDAAGNVTLWLFPTANQPYTLSAIPPSGSPFAAANVANVTFTTDTTETITLTPPLTLGGQVTGGLGQPLPNQTVRLHPAGGGAGLSTTTDGNGQYSFQTGAW